MSGARAISTTSRREMSSSSPPQGRVPKEIHVILTETLACFLPGRAKELSATLYLWSMLCIRSANKAQLSFASTNSRLRYSISHTMDVELLKFSVLGGESARPRDVFLFFPSGYNRERHRLVSICSLVLSQYWPTRDLHVLRLFLRISVRNSSQRTFNFLCPPFKRIEFSYTVLINI